MKLNDNVVPLELIVGISGDLCFITYIDTKGKKEQINSEVSWRNWSANSDNPLKAKNKFMKGFKLAGANRRWGNRARNQDNLLIYHPLAKKSFEISMSDFLHLASQCNIKKGEFDIEMIMDKKRGLLTKADYEKEIQEKCKGANAKQELKDKLKAAAVKYKDIVRGKVYKNRNNNCDSVYLGTCAHFGKTYHCYYEPWGGAKSGDCRTTSKLHSVSEVEHPVILDICYHYSSKGWKYIREGEIVLRIAKTPLAAHPNKDFNVIEGLTKKEWDIINNVYKQQEWDISWGNS